MDRRRKYFLADPLDMGKEEVCYWTSWLNPCSGCHETGEYGVTLFGGGYDHKRKMEIGAGCNECGYTGVRRQWWPCPVSGDVGVDDL